MHFSHSPDLRQRFPDLRVLVLAVEGIHVGADVQEATDDFIGQAQRRLLVGAEGEWPEIQAWRRAFSSLGLKPTQYRCASESLLRRLRKEGALPRLHPLVDLCNAASAAFAIPIAVLDRARIEGDLQVRFARGDEHYEGFGGELETPEPGEVSFVDTARRAHARRWTHRQSGWSAVRAGTSEVLVVAEALHANAAEDLQRLGGSLVAAITAGWGVAPRCQSLTDDQPLFRV